MNYKNIKFELTKKQVDKVNEINKEDSVLQYIFIPTGIGDIVKVKTKSEKYIDITDYDSW